MEEKRGWSQFFEFSCRCASLPTGVLVHRQGQGSGEARFAPLPGLCINYLLQGRRRCPDCVVLPWAPRRTARERQRGPSSHALSSRRLRPFVTTTSAQSGLETPRCRSEWRNASLMLCVEKCAWRAENQNRSGFVFGTSDFGFSSRGQPVENRRLPFRTR